MGRKGGTGRGEGREGEKGKGRGGEISPPRSFLKVGAYARYQPLRTLSAQT